MHNHFTRVDTRLHRVTEVDEASAEEGAYPPGYGWRENQGDYIHDVPKPKKVPRVDGDNVGIWLGLWSVLLVAIGAFVALVLA